MRQINPEVQDRKLWGRMIDGYDGAYGTGQRLIDPYAEEMGLDGHLWMIAPIEEFHLRDAWVGSGMSTTHPQSAWHNIATYKEFKIHLCGYKIKKGFLSSSVWPAHVRFMLDTVEVHVGWLIGIDIPSLFAHYDKWLSGGAKPHRDIEKAVQSS